MDKRWILTLLEKHLECLREGLESEEFLELEEETEKAIALLHDDIHGASVESVSPTLRSKTDSSKGS